MQRKTNIILNNQKIQVTNEGYQTLLTELKELKNVRRPEVVEQLAFAREQGDLSENAAYINNKEELDFVDGRIDELEDIINQSEVISTQNKGRSQVAIGNKVTLSIGNRKDKHTYHVVGEWEADPKQKKISHESPLGKALIGKKVGAAVEVKAPAGKVVYTIVSID